MAFDGHPTARRAAFRAIRKIKPWSLSQVVGLGLIVRVRMHELPRRRFALSDEGPAICGEQRPNLALGTAKRWVPGSDEESAGTMFGKMELESSHTEGVNDFAARLQIECGGDSYIVPSLRGNEALFRQRGRLPGEPDLIAALVRNAFQYTLVSGV